MEDLSPTREPAVPATATTRAESGDARRVAFAGLLAMAVAMGIGRFVYTPILPFMEEALPLTKSQAGVIASFNYVGYLVGALGVAWPGLRGSRRDWLVVGMAISALTTAAMGLTDWFPLFLALRFAGGLASAVVLVIGSALVLDRLAARGRPNLMALHFAGVGLGIAASAALVSWVATWTDWRAMWLISGLAAMAAVVLVGLLVAGVTGDHDPPPIERGRPFGRPLVTLIVAYGLFGFGYVITATFISALVRETPSVAHLEGVVFLVVGLAAAPSVFLWGSVSGRLGNNRTVALACLVEGVGVAVSVLFESTAAILSAAVLLGGTFVGISAIGLVAARALDPAAARRSIALMTASFGLGQMIGPSFAGYAYDLAGSFLIPSLVAAGALVLAAALAAATAGRRHSPSAPTGGTNPVRPA